jgi:deoxyribonuclease-4
VIEGVERPERLGVCIDTCHLLAAGYDFRAPAGYHEVFEEFDRRVGIDRIRAFHLNDSKQDLGSRVDRHEHIGKGYVGTAAFRMILQDPRFRRAPKVLETPKKDEMDRKNLALLRRLARMPAPEPPGRS